MLAGFLALEKLGNPAEIAEAVKRLDVDTGKTLSRLRRVAAFASGVVGYMRDGLDR
jgi:hypothetical protein